MNKVKDERPIVYSAVLGGYDDPPFIPTASQLNNYRFILFSDVLEQAVGWELINISSDQPVMSNRKIKMFPWDYFDSRHTFYIDGHVSLGTNYDELFSSLIEGDYVFAVQKHREGGSVRSELVRCIDNGKLNRLQLQKILDASLDTQPIAVECGFIYRDSQSDVVRSHAASWWNLFNTICPRDQLWVSQAALQAGLEIKVIDSSFNDVADYLRVGIHKNARMKNIKARFKKAMQIIKTGLVL